MSTKLNRLTHSIHHARSNCAACAVRDKAICADISITGVVGLQTQATDFTLPAGTVLQTMAAPVEAVFGIRAGAVKLIKYEANGGQRIVRILKRGDLAGIDWALAGKAEHTAIAIGEIHVCRMPVKRFLDFIFHRADLQMRLLYLVQDALRESELWLSQLVGGPIPARVRMARVLLRLCDDEDKRIYRLGNEDMGAILGVAEETVSRVIADFLRQGILMRTEKLDGARYFWADLDALEGIAANSCSGSVMQAEAWDSTRLRRVEDCQGRLHRVS